MNKISYFDAPITNTTPTRELTLDEVAKLIQSDTYKQTIEEARSSLQIGNKKAYDDIKNTRLPYLTFSGTFTQRNNNNLKEYSGFVCMDFDHLGTDLEPIRQRIASDKNIPVAMIFRSPSNEGLKVIIKALDKERHLDYYRALLAYFDQTYNLKGDKTSDIARPCFISYDPAIYFNPNYATDSRIFAYEEYQTTTKTCYVIKTFEATESAMRLLNEIKSRVEKDKIDITSDYNTEYFPLMSAIAKDCGEDGREACRAICKISSKYNPAIFDDFYTKRVNDSNNKHTIGTLLYLAHKYNVPFNKTDALVATSSNADRKPQTSDQGKLIALIVKNNAEGLIEAMTILQPKYFLDAQLREVYTAMIELLNKGRDLTTDNIVELLPNTPEDYRILFRKRLMEFRWSLEPQDKVGDIARRIKETYAKVYINSQIKNLNESDASAFDKLQKINTITTTIEEMQAEQLDVTSVANDIPDLLDNLRRLHECDGGITGLASGYYQLDTVTAGFQPATMVIIAGRPGQGKTALAMSMIRNIVEAGHPVAFFSLEMSKRELLERLLSSVAEIPHDDLRSGRIPPDDFRLKDGVEKMRRYPLYLFDGGITFAQLRAKCLLEKRRHNVEMIVIDHIGLITASKTGRSRQEEVAEFSRGLKLLAKMLDIPIVVLCQLNRGNVMRASKVPMLHDLRESGAIEQDADIVAFVHRPYEIGEKDDGTGGSTKGLAEIHIAKHRAGRTMLNDEAIKMTFNAKFVRFDDGNDSQATQSTETTKQEPQADPLAKAKKRGHLTAEEDPSLPF